MAFGTDGMNESLMNAANCPVKVAQLLLLLTACEQSPLRYMFVVVTAGELSRVQGKLCIRNTRKPLETWVGCHCCCHN